MLWLLWRMQPLQWVPVDNLLWRCRFHWGRYWPGFLTRDQTFFFLKLVLASFHKICCRLVASTVWTLEASTKAGSPMGECSLTFWHPGHSMKQDSKKLSKLPPIFLIVTSWASGATVLQQLAQWPPPLSWASVSRPLGISASLTFMGPTIWSVGIDIIN